MTKSQSRAESSRRGGGRVEFVWYRIGATILNAAAVVLLAHQSPPREFGIVVTGLATLIAAGIIFDLGAGGHIIRARAVDRDAAAVPTIVRLNKITNLLLASAACAVVAALSIWVLDRESALILIPIAVAVPVEKSTQLFGQVHLADGNLRVCGINLLLQRAAHLLLFGLGISFMGAGMSFTAGYLAAALLAAIHMNRYRPKITVRRSEYAPVLRAGLPFLGNSAGGHLRNFDLMALSLVAGPAEAALYAIPARLGAALLLLPSTLSPLVISSFARNPSLKRLLARKVVSGLAGGTALLALVVAFSPVIASFVTPAEYGSITDVTILYFIGLACLCGTTLTSSVLLGLGRVRALAIVSLIANACLLLGVLLGGWQNGAVGAALAFAVIQVVQLLLLSSLARAAWRSQETEDY